MIQKKCSGIALSMHLRQSLFCSIIAFLVGAMVDDELSKVLRHHTHCSPTGDYFSDIGDLARACDEFSQLDVMSSAHFNSTVSSSDRALPRRLMV